MHKLINNEVGDERKEVFQSYIKVYSRYFPRTNKQNSPRKGRHITYDVTLRRFSANTLPWTIHKYYIFWVGICSLRYSACKAHMPYFHVWSARLYHIFPHYLLKDKIFGKNFVEHKMCFVFCTALVWNISHFPFPISHFKKNWARYDHKCT
jgi:hypothetical protein